MITHQNPRKSTSALDAPIASTVPPVTAVRFGQDAISNTSTFRNGTISSSPTAAPSARYNIPPTALASPHHPADIPLHLANTTSFTSQRTPTQSTFPMIRHEGILPQPSSSHGSDTATSWTFPEHLHPSTSIPDGEPFVHLAQPLASSGSVQLPYTVSPKGTLPATQPSTPAACRSSRKKDRSRDEPQSLAELRDPSPGLKPDYSYPTLIRCAILSHWKRSPTLSEIYDMIHKRFAFFKMNDGGWKNSVRHYLSISPSFVKIPRPITEPGKGNYWTYDANPPNEARRRNKRAKRNRDRDDKVGARDDECDNGGRVYGLPPHLPSLPSNGRYTPRSGDLGDTLRSSLPSFGGRDRGIASRQKCPAHGWLEARDDSLDGKNLPPAQALFAGIGGPPMPSSHTSRSGTGGPGVSSVSPGDQVFNTPHLSIAVENRTGGNVDFGVPPVFQGRDQSQHHPGSSTHSQTLHAFSSLGVSSFSDIALESRQSRHREEPLPSMSSGTNGNYNSLPSLLRYSPPARNDHSSLEHYRYGRPALSSNSDW